jgi:hypothetical protein
MTRPVKRGPVVWHHGEISMKTASQRLRCVPTTRRLVLPGTVGPLQDGRAFCACLQPLAPAYENLTTVCIYLNT